MKIVIGNARYGVATLVGTIVGVGIFGLPYAASKAGFFTQLFYLGAFAGVFVLLHLMFAEIMLRTTQRHRLAGYTGVYFGEAAKKFIELITVVGTLGGMLAYLLVGGLFLKTLTGGIFGGIEQYYIIFWALLSFVLFSGLKMVERMEAIMLFFIVVIIALLFVVSIPFVDAANYSFSIPENFFFPYGVTLFALAGTAAIPAVRDMLKNEERKIKKTIIWGTLIPVALYAIFIFSVVGVTGSATSEDALTGLNGILGKPMVLVGALFGLLVISTSYIVFGLYLKDTLWYDFNVHRKVALWFVLAAPLVLVLFQPASFIEIIGFLGAVFGGIEAIFIIATFRQARRHGDRVPEYQLKIPAVILYSLIALFASGIVYTLFDGTLNL
ncbi:MAG: aromatic amino acid transport family protein [Patescibacteria group bacterium]